MMRRATAVFGAAAVLLCSVGAFAQAKPTFAGSWTPDTEKTMAANPGQSTPPTAPRPMAIKQDLASLTIERLGAPAGPQPITYKLDNQPAEVTASQTQGPAQVRAQWVGDTIVLETTREAQGAKVVSTVAYAREGAWLVVTSTQPRPSGGTTVIKTYYKTTK